MTISERDECASDFVPGFNSDPSIIASPSEVRVGWEVYDLGFRSLGKLVLVRKAKFPTPGYVELALLLAKNDQQ